MPSYRAIRRGQTPDGVWHEPGDVFSTDARKGMWMEALDPEEEEKPRRGRPPRAAD